MRRRNHAGFSALSRPIPVIVVGFRNPEDILGCLDALARAAAEPAFDVHVCENGGPAAFDALCAALAGRHAETAPEPWPGAGFLRLRRFALGGRAASIHVGEAPDNLGYGGGINAWLRPLAAAGGWPGAWILNPDTQPAPDALAAMLACAARSAKGMVGSVIVDPDRPRLVRTRGLRWDRWRGQVMAVDRGRPLTPAPEAVELDSPSGASLYVTAACLARIGLPEDRYFLYYEDLEWGLRAKAAGELVHCPQAVVFHAGGTTIGSGHARRAPSPLAAYLEFRNRLHFVRGAHPAWLPWTIGTSALRLLRHGARGEGRAMRAGFAGMRAALRGEWGRAFPP
ncbi:MAG: hypothetical protein K2X11_19930 [Acetobacteraceae bacterium]|nr:hypothetical protein [Acetobacteraceae bacterium]